MFPSPWIQRLDRSPVVHRLIRALRVRSLAGAWLRRFPRVRRLPGGAVYRQRTLESLVVADEWFRRGIYRAALDPAAVRTFADLGCNAGYAAVWLREATGRTGLRGLMADANPAMAEEARWHARANQLEGVSVVCGLAGADRATPESDFYLLPSNLGSSQFPVYDPAKPPQGAWEKISVPALDLEAEWVRAVGDVPCDWLKVDIEGSESRLPDTDPAFLRRARVMVLEWHKWLVNRDDLDRKLAALGMELAGVLEDHPTTGLAWYKRR